MQKAPEAGLAQHFSTMRKVNEGSMFSGYARMLHVVSVQHNMICKVSPAFNTASADLGDLTRPAPHRSSPCSKRFLATFLQLSDAMDSTSKSKILNTQSSLGAGDLQTNRANRAASFLKAHWQIMHLFYLGALTWATTIKMSMKCQYSQTFAFKTPGKRSFTKPSGESSGMRFLDFACLAIFGWLSSPPDGTKTIGAHASS